MARSGTVLYLVSSIVAGNPDSDFFKRQRLAVGSEHHERHCMTVGISSRDQLSVWKLGFSKSLFLNLNECTKNLATYKNNRLSSELIEIAAASSIRLSVMDHGRFRHRAQNILCSKVMSDSG